MRARLVAMVLLSGCSWSNSLYQARALSGEAARAERGGRPAEAAGLWSQAAVKAESAYVRAPHGKHGAEAQWLLGRALARTRDCDRGRAYLEFAQADAPGAKWKEPLQLELARCVELVDTARAAMLFAALRSSRDDATRREARERAGRDLVATGQPALALDILSGIDLPGPRMHRAIALAMLGRADSALGEAAPLLALPDTALNWNRLIGALAATPGDAADRLVGQLAARPGALPADVDAWRLEALQGTAEADGATFQRRLALLLTGQEGPSLTRGRVLAAERRAREVGSLPALVAMHDSLARLPAPARDPLSQRRWAHLLFLTGRVASEVGTLGDGAPEGDLRFFAVAELARDSLAAPHLAAFLFQRLERGWPGSPYLAKALLARIMLEPDSAGPLRARVAAMEGSPYLAYLRGREDASYRQLEDSLGRYVRNLAAEAARANAENVIR